MALVKLGRTSLLWSRAIVGLLMLCMLPVLSQTDSQSEDRLQNTIKALQQIQPESIRQNPVLREKVVEILDRLEGREVLIELVIRFEFEEKAESVLRTALAIEDLKTAVAGVRFLLKHEQVHLLESVIKRKGEPARKLVRLLGMTGDSQSVKWMSPVLADKDSSDELRRAAVRALVRTREGADLLLEKVEQGELPPGLTGLAGELLRSVRWDETRERAFLVLPPPQNRDARPLPPISELLQLEGDPEIGREVFNRDTTLCSSCHRVRGEGQDFGPDLSEIGDKLGREALFDSILNPSAGISFGYEAWSFEFKDGEEAFGLVISEEEDKWVLKQQADLTMDILKSDIVSHKKQSQSIMPSGLQMAMSTQELVDLVAYLSSLRKSKTIGKNE